MSIQPEIKEPTNAENADDERADRPHRSDSPTSTAEVAKETERPERSATSDDAAITLFPEKEANDFHTRWTDIQTGFAEERSKLEGQWGRGDDVSTEDLRVTLQRYRAFFDRLLKV